MTRRSLPSTSRTIPGTALLVAALAGPAAAGGSSAPAALPAPPAAGAAIRDVALTATPAGDLLLGTVEDHGTGRSWRGAFNARVVRVARLQGGTWQPLGSVLNYDQPRPASDLDLTSDAAGTPVAVWNENYGDNDVIVFRAYRDGAWTRWPTRYLGVSSPAAARTRAVVAREGEPVLIHGEYRGNPERRTWLTLRAWDDVARTWSRSVPLNDLSQYSRSPTMALDRRDRPVVAFVQGEVTASVVIVKRWTGTAWEALGGPLNRAGARYVATPTLALDTTGRPTVAWLEDQDGVDALFAATWTGRSWAALGGALNTAPASQPAVTLDRAGRPVVAWTEERGPVGSVHVATWVAGQWQRTRVSGDVRRDARTPSVATSRTVGTVLAWREDVAGRYRLRLIRVP